METITKIEIILVIIASELLWAGLGGRELDPAWFIYVPIGGLLFYYTFFKPLYNSYKDSRERNLLVDAEEKTKSVK